MPDKIKILFIDSTHPVLKEKLTYAGFECDDKSTFSCTEIFDIIHLYEGIIIRSRIPVNKELIDKAINLKFIGRLGAGMENIDIEYTKKNGIQCFNSPEGNRDAVGEHALGMLLALMNNICKSNQEVRNGIWLREPNRGVEIKGKTVGIIGYGNMGSSFAKKLSGFEANIIAYDKYKFNYSNEIISESTLETLFEKTDILSLHIPLNEETTYMVDDAFIKKFQKPIYLINTSRGKILKTDDLVKNLESGKVNGAALDVMEYEKASFENISSTDLPDALKYLFKSDRVVLTPHIAGWTQESNIKLAEILADKIIYFVKNRG